MKGILINVLAAIGAISLLLVSAYLATLIVDVYTMVSESQERIRQIELYQCSDPITGFNWNKPECAEIYKQKDE